MYGPKEMDAAAAEFHAALARDGNQTKKAAIM
jgi:hypothetical protein